MRNFAVQLASMLLGDSPSVVWSHGFRGAVDVRWCSEGFYYADRTSDRSALLRSTFRRPPVPILSPQPSVSCSVPKRISSSPKLGRHLRDVTIQLSCMRWAAQVLRDEFLPSPGILCGGIPALVFTSPMSPQRNTFHWYSFRFISGKQVTSLIQCTVLGVMVAGGKWKRSLHYYISLLEFKFTRETLWLINFEIHYFTCTPMECDKLFAIPCCINILIWTINVCWRDINFVKIIT
jgi:hypothetical protein